ncbi:MAG: TIGR03759 family integrating conjugative element protein [Gammaproteobacteria bacterium]|nr:TIGR03759 family integrating conjugative element protein [Gammaproteobacteria bacterium]
MTGRARRIVGPAMLAAALAWTAGSGALGAETADSEMAESEVRDSGRRAATWGLSAEDWTRYEELMRGRRGVWTPDADPLLILGAHARTAAERRRYAEAFVIAEHRRVEGELAFERAVQAAWARLFPRQPRIAAPPPAPAPERYAVVLDRDCADCADTLRGYLKGAAPVDVYVRGAADDDDLRAWASAQGVDAADVRRGRVTVNHGDGGIPGDAPAVWARRGGRWTAVE